MDDGRPAPAPATEVIEARSNVTRVAVAIFTVLAAIAAAVGITIWSRAGWGWSALAPGLVGLALVAPLGLLLGSTVMSRSTSLGERLAGWSNPTLEFTPWPPQLGRVMTVVYRRRPISNRARGKLLGSVEVQATVRCEEWVQYTVGTDTRTERHDVATIRWSAPSNPVDGGIEAVFTIHIPTDVGGPSINLDHNRVRWDLTSRLGHPFGKRTQTSIELPVAAVLDRSELVTEGYGDEPAPEVGP